MLLTQNKITEIERLVDTLKKWREGDIPQAFKDCSRYVQLILFVEPQVNVVLIGLSSGMSGTARGIHLKFGEILNKAAQVDSLGKENSDETCFEDSDLRRLARSLILMLERIVKSPRGRRAQVRHKVCRQKTALSSESLAGLRGDY
jgi:hypothetical protein